MMDGVASGTDADAVEQRDLALIATRSALLFIDARIDTT